MSAEIWLYSIGRMETMQERVIPPMPCPNCSCYVCICPSFPEIGDLSILDASAITDTDDDPADWLDDQCDDD